MWEDYRDAVHECRQKTCMARGQLELKLTSSVGDNKNFSNYVNNKRTLKVNLGLLLAEVCHLINMDEDKARDVQCLLSLGP